MAHVIAPIALVLPVFNEALALPELLAAITRQSLKPAEIIFCDAGSSDETPQIIQTWWQQNQWQGTTLTVVIKPDAMPGAGRNVGVGLAKSPWIAFLDGGITPEQDWLHSLWVYVNQYQVKAVFGVCRFDSSDTIGLAVCALSYGVNAKHPVVPASLFHQDVFKQAGLFWPNLRAAEDLLWMRQVDKCFGRRQICHSAQVVYTHFPLTIRSTVKKWYLIQQHTVFSGARLKQLIAYPLAAIIFSIFCMVQFKWALVLVIGYFIARGILDPWRRSGRCFWWRDSWTSFWLAPVLALAIDSAKLAGTIVGVVKIRHFNQDTPAES
jgi:glycosyltransferase involved in cell wall biosynthesis